MTINEFFLIKYVLDIYDSCIPQHAVLALYYFDTQVCPYQAIYMACLNLSHQCTCMYLYNKQGQVQHCVDMF
jgi:hypothetical protein